MNTNAAGSHRHDLPVAVGWAIDSIGSKASIADVAALAARVGLLEDEVVSLNRRLLAAAAGGGGFVVPPAPDLVGYFIAPTGNNTTGDGSVEAPWATIQKFIDANPDADTTLYCRGGTYTNHAMASTGHYSSGSGNLLGESGAPITITAYPGETPIFTQTTATNAAIGLTPNYANDGDGARYVVIDGLTFTNFRPTSSGIIYCGAWSNSYYVHHITIRNCYFGHRSGATDQDHGVYFSRGSQYVTVEDCIFEGAWKIDGSGGGALHLYTDNGNASSKDFLMQRNAIDGWKDGVILWDANSTPNATGQILHNTIVNCSDNLDLRYHSTITYRDNVGETAAANNVQDLDSGDSTADHNYWGETITAAPAYGLTAGSSAINGAADGSDAGWKDYVP